MAIDFPSPAVQGQSFSAAGKTWVYDTNFGWLSAQASNPAAQYIAKVVTSGSQANVTFNNIPQNFTDLYIVVQARDTTAGTSTGNTWVLFNGDATAANYDGGKEVSAGGSLSTGATASSAKGLEAGYIPNDGATANAASLTKITIPNYTGAWLKNFIAETYVRYGTAPSLAMATRVGTWLSAVPITSLTISPDGAFKNGSVITLYGLGAVATSPAVYESSTAPGTPYAGMLWWKSDEGTLKIYYNGAWIDASAPGSVKIAKFVCVGGETSVAFGSIPAIYSDLKVRFQARDTNAAVDFNAAMQMNGDTAGANYSVTTQSVTSNVTAATNHPTSTTPGIVHCAIPGAGSPAGYACSAELVVTNYAGLFHKNVICTSYENAGSAGSNPFTGIRSGSWLNVAPVVTLTFPAPGTAYAAGSTFTLYGMG